MVSQKQPGGKVVTFTLPPYDLPPIAAKLLHAASVVTCEYPRRHAWLFAVPTKTAKGAPPWLWTKRAPMCYPEDDTQQGAARMRPSVHRQAVRRNHPHTAHHGHTIHSHALGVSAARTAHAATAQAGAR